MHRGGVGTLRDIDWVERRWDPTKAYSESKLYVAAIAFAIARRWPDVLSNAVDRRTTWKWDIRPKPGLFHRPI